jgi:mono/diheme cytochrome c family protein
MNLRSLVAIALCTIGAGALWRIHAQSAPMFTAAQSDAGRAVYSESCSSCHGDNLDDGRFAPPLRGSEFRQKWSGRTLDELFAYMRDKMPPERPGALESKTYAALVSHL